MTYWWPICSIMAEHRNIYQRLCLSALKTRWFLLLVCCHHDREWSWRDGSQWRTIDDHKSGKSIHTLENVLNIEECHWLYPIMIKITVRQHRRAKTDTNHKVCGLDQKIWYFGAPVGCSLTGHAMAHTKILQVWKLIYVCIVYLISQEW